MPRAAADEPAAPSFQDAAGGIEDPSLGSAWDVAGETEEDPYAEWGPGQGPMYVHGMPGDPTADMATEDLPTYEEGGTRPDPFAKLKDMLLRDTTTAVGVATAASLLVVLAIVVVLQAF